MVAIAATRSIEFPVWASAMQSPHTGVGVVQREIYRRLPERGIQLTVSPPESPSQVLRVLRSFTRSVGSRQAGALVSTTPAPFMLRVPAVLLVYDLRWRRTRGRWTRLYRYLDLRRSVAKAVHIFAISQRTRAELIGLLPGAARKCTVLHLGPGIVGAADFDEGEEGTVLLAGGAAYKRNELVAEAMAECRPDWARRFLCVGVSEAAFQTLVSAYGADSCERLDNLDDDLMRSTFRRARVYITASIEEGFGLPMVEALYAGCQVVAMRQPLTVEVLGDAGVLIDDGNLHSIVRQLDRPAWVPPGIRQAQASLFSWDTAADAVAEALQHPPV